MSRRQLSVYLVIESDTPLKTISIASTRRATLVRTREVGEKQQFVLRGGVASRVHDPRPPPVQVPHQRQQPGHRRPGRPRDVQQIRGRVDQALVESAVQRAPDVHVHRHVGPSIRHVVGHAPGEL